MIQTAIVIIVFGAVCGLVGYLFAWDKAWKQGHKHGKREANIKTATETLSLLEGFTNTIIDDNICEHPQPPKDPYRRLLDDICRLPEKPMVIDDPPQKIPPEWE